MIITGARTSRPVTSTTGVAWAASGDSESSTDAGTANDTAKTTTDTPSTSADTAATEPKSKAVSEMTAPAPDPGDTTSTSPSAVTDEVAPGVVVSSSGGALTSKDDDAKNDDAAPAKESGAKHRKRAATKPRLTQTSSGTQSPGDDTSPAPADAPAPAPQPAVDAGPVTEAASATSVVAVTTAAEPVVEHVSSATVPEAPTETVTTAVATTLLSTVLGGTSDTPTDSPAEWALLAAARRGNRRPRVTTSEAAAPATMAVTASAQPQLVVTGSIPAGSSPYGVDVGYGDKIYVTNRDADTVTVIDRTTGAVIKTIAVGDAPSAVDSTLTLYYPPQSTVSQWIYQTYVANGGSGTVTVLDAADHVTATVKVGTNPVAVQVSPEGNRVWVVNAGSDLVTKINTVTNTVTATIKVGTNPSSIAFDTKNAYVTNAGSGTVSVINLLSNKVTTITGVGGSPTGITVPAARPMSPISTAPSPSSTPPPAPSPATSPCPPRPTPRH